MILRVEDIKTVPQILEYTEEVGQLNSLLCNREPSEYQFAGGLRVRLTYYRSGSELFFSGSVGGPAVGTCCRCLEEYSFAEQKSFSLVLSPPKGAKAAELGVDELKESEYQGPEIDLTPLIHEQAILGLPTRALCKSGCRGLCPICGENRNLVECGCHRPNLDPRLAVLRSLKVSK